MPKKKVTEAVEETAQETIPVEKAPCTDATPSG